jgi:hypothetical protein
MTRAIRSPMTETVIDDADSVSADGGAVSADAGSASADAGHLSDLKPERSSRQDQNRDAAAPKCEMSTAACTSPASRASTTSGTRMSRPTIRMARGASVIDDAGDQFADD